MEERKEIILKIVSLGMSTSKALSIAGICKSTFYYKSNGRKKGKRPSGWTLYQNQAVPDEMVVQKIEDTLAQDFIDYGYIRTSKELKNLGYYINKKKVYRIMKEHKFLYPKRRSLKSASKKYVEFSSPLCFRPFETIEVDIKYIYIYGEKRNAYLITMLDVFTRTALGWTLNFDMKTHRVIDLLNQLYVQWLMPQNIDPLKLMVKIRTDNGSQFIAKLFKEHLNQARIQNEYIHPATPQQNGHIESFHKTLTELVCNKYIFEDFEHAHSVLEKFYDVYNNKRIMRSILYKSPIQFFKLWQENLVETKVVNKKIKHFLRERKPENQAFPPNEQLYVHHKLTNKFDKQLITY